MRPWLALILAKLLHLLYGPIKDSRISLAYLPTMLCLKDFLLKVSDRTGSYEFYVTIHPSFLVDVHLAQDHFSICQTVYNRVSSTARLNGNCKKEYVEPIMGLTHDEDQHLLLLQISQRTNAARLNNKTDNIYIYINIP
jgi:hypothetical protein